MSKSIPPLPGDRPYPRHRITNLLQSAILMLALLALVSVTARIVLGEGAMWGALLGTALALLLAPSISPALVLSLYRARRLQRAECPELFEILEWLAHRAGLPMIPSLHYIASPQPNAITVGTAERGAIAVTGGLLRSLDMRELTGVLAHEISHLRNRDTTVMGVSDLLSRMVALLSLSGMLLAILAWAALPEVTLADVLFAVLLFASLPWISNLLQFALSRTREFDADADAAILSGDPEGLASALQHIDAIQRRHWWLHGLPFRRAIEPSALRSHPPTAARIERLLAMRIDSDDPPPFVRRRAAHAFDPVSNRPRWHWNGLWY